MRGGGGRQWAGSSNVVRGSCDVAAFVKSLGCGLVSFAALSGVSRSSLSPLSERRAADFSRGGGSGWEEGGGGEEGLPHARRDCREVCSCRRGEGNVTPHQHACRDTHGGSVPPFKISKLYMQSILDGNWSRTARFSVGNETNSRTHLDVHLQTTEEDSTSLECRRG